MGQHPGRPAPAPVLRPEDAHGLQAALLTADFVSECGELFTRLQAQGGLFAQSSYLSRAGSKPQGPQEGWRGLPARAHLGRCGEPLWPESALCFPKQASDWRPSLSACFCQQVLESEISWGS